MTEQATIYALYQGSELVAVGTADQLAKLLGKPKQTIYWYASAQAHRTRAVAVDQPTATNMFAKKNSRAMADMCSRICRVTRGRCRVSEVGCDWLGWCEPCYRAACQLMANQAEERRGDEQRAERD